MSGLSQVFCVGLLALAGHVVLVLIALRGRWLDSPMAVHVCSALLWLAVTVALSLLWKEGAGMWGSLALFVFGAAVLLFAYSAVYKSISLRLLRELIHGPSSCVSYERLAELTVHRSFDERIEMLTGTGQVEQHEEGYRLTSAGRRTAAMIGLVRRFMAAESSGMYGHHANEG